MKFGVFDACFVMPFLPSQLFLHHSSNLDLTFNS
nr:MAG TPA: hypothetical protein [Caudoviricetes sp.]